MVSSINSAPPETSEPPKERWVEPVIALLMALSTLWTAWCSYQSATWTRRANRQMNDFSALERRSGIITLKGMENSIIHVAMFMQVLAAQQSGNQELADFYVQRFPPDVRKAFDAWTAQKPFEAPNAAPHPFVPELYQIRGSREAAEFSAKAEDALRESRNAGNISGQYLSNTVLFAAVLFFANAAGKFEQRRVRLIAIAFAIVVFSVAVARMLLLPL